MATKEKAISGFFWTFAERFAAQGVTFVVSVILARLLTPDDYGVVAIVSIFTAIADVFVKSGLGSALIQKKDADLLDFSTVFYFNVFTSICIYVLIFFLSPYIASYYDNALLTAVIRVSALGLILHGINNVQQAYVSKHLDFKKFFYSTLIGTIVSAIVGIIMAYVGFGVWALVAQQLLNSLMDTVILQITISWSPTKQFSFVRLKCVYHFGWKLLISDLSASLYSNLQSMIIGKRYSSTDLALYNKGTTFPSIISRNLDNSIQSVAFPLMSSVQDDHEEFKHIMFRSCTMSYFVICPMMIGMSAVAHSLVQVLLTDKWLGCVPYLQLFCIVYLLRPLEATNLQALYALGRSDITLKLDIIKKVFGIFLLVISVLFFDNALAIGFTMVICTVFNTILNMTMVSKLVGYGVFQQVKSVFGITAAAVIMGSVCYFLGFSLSAIAPVSRLSIQIIAGALVYIMSCSVFKLQAFSYALNYAKSIWTKRKAPK